LRAAGNAAFAEAEERVVAMVKAGREISEALRTCSAFPEEFIDIITVAEVSGQIPEVMIRQAEHYREEAARRLKALTRFSSIAVYCLVGVMLIIAIFRIASVYLNAVNAAAG
jgi:type IV pilus assembly protein PilC